MEKLVNPEIGEVSAAPEISDASANPDVSDASADPEIVEGSEDREASAAEGCCCAGGRTRHRTEKEHRDLINRLSRIEGQIRGLKGMIERDAYCIDIINQAAAAGSALNSFSKVLLTDHIRTCVAEDVREGNDEKVDELVKTLQKLLR